MINLKELEIEIDKLLSKESPSSLKRWLKKKRNEKRYGIFKKCNSLYN